MEDKSWEKNLEEKTDISDLKQHSFMQDRNIRIRPPAPGRFRFTRHLPTCLMTAAMHRPALTSAMQAISTAG